MEELLYASHGFFHFSSSMETWFIKLRSKKAFVYLNTIETTTDIFLCVLSALQNKYIYIYWDSAYARAVVPPKVESGKWRVKKTVSCNYAQESLKVTPICLKCLNQVCLQERAVMHYCIAGVCFVASDDRQVTC